jgi:uncharacterized protein (TIGR00725 family)
VRGVGSWVTDMDHELYLAGRSGRLHAPDGRVFDAWAWQWSPSAAPAGELDPIDAVGALRHLARTGRCRRVPIGVIGPREATATQIDTAERLGRALADLGLVVLCGGTGGVMEAVARGVHARDGLCVGLLPEDDWRAANDFVTLPLATGIGKARNVLIAQASRALIAVGGQLGTLSEIAFGLHFDKPVFGLDEVPDVPGIRRCASVDEVLEGLAPHLLGLDALSRDPHVRLPSEAGR